MGAHSRRRPPQKGDRFVHDGGHTARLPWAELTEAGHDGRLKPWDAFWGQRYAVVHAPDGNAVDLFAASAA